MSRAWVGLICFALGLALGAGLMRAQLSPAPSVATEPALPAAPAQAPGAAVNRQPPIVWVTFEDGVNARRVPALLLGEPAVLLLTFADFMRADRATWTDTRGRQQSLDTAVAMNLELGLIAFAHDGQSAPPLGLSRDDGSLYLGLDVELRAPLATRTAFIDSAAIERGLNDYRFELAGFSALDASMAAVIDPQAGHIAGLALREGPRWTAMDAGTLRALLERPLRPPVQPLGAVADRVFGEPLGLAREFDSLMADRPLATRAHPGADAERARTGTASPGAHRTRAGGP